MPLPPSECHRLSMNCIRNLRANYLQTIKQHLVIPRYAPVSKGRRVRRFKGLGFKGFNQFKGLGLENISLHIPCAFRTELQYKKNRSFQPFPIPGLPFLGGDLVDITADYLLWLAKREYGKQIYGG